MAELERTVKQAKLLTDELSSGVLGIPEIQRDYVWKESQAVDLVDSMYKQYPVGMILLWKPTTLPKLRNGNKNPNYLILDGQQRITTLEKIFSGKIKVLFDVKNETFYKQTSPLLKNSNLVSVKDIFKDPFTVYQSVEDKIELDKPLILERITLVKDIGKYDFPVMIMNTDNYEEITESFIRLNSKGTILRSTELAMAKLAFHWPGSIIDKFDIAIDEFESIGFNFTPSFLMKCFLAVAHGKSSTHNNLNKVWAMKEEELSNTWNEAKKSIEKSINFLKNNAGIESKKWMKSENTIITLSFFFFKKSGKKITEVEIKGLLFWFFVTSIFGRYSSKVLLVDKDIKALNESGSLHKLYDNLKHDISSFTVTTDMLRGAYYQSKFLPLLFTIIKNNGASDWFTGISLSSESVGYQSQVQQHHIFPVSYMKKHGYLGREKTAQVNDLTNIVFLSQEANIKIFDNDPEKYLHNIDRKRLEDQFVPIYGEMWKADRYIDFCQERRKLICNAINNYLLELKSKLDC